ncbi:MAG TPA: hypothetical protein VM008_04145 [Phycisphaerae bacterium]|nr:hypothetical protein [Phycisphaerae bacterium]
MLQETLLPKVGEARLARSEGIEWIVGAFFFDILFVSGAGVLAGCGGWSGGKEESDRAVSAPLERRATGRKWFEGIQYSARK